jgi:hypothetical protein
MSSGEKAAIEGLQVGDLVATPEGPRAIERMYRIESDHIRELRYRTMAVIAHEGVASDPPAPLRLLRTTDEHLFWVDGRGWLPAGDLSLGDALVLDGGAVAQIVETRRLETPQTVYNFDVEGAHSYYANDAMVYQKCGADLHEAQRDEATHRIDASLKGTDSASTGDVCPVLTDPLQEFAEPRESCR